MQVLYVCFSSDKFLLEQTQVNILYIIIFCLDNEYTSSDTRKPEAFNDTHQTNKFLFMMSKKVCSFILLIGFYNVLSTISRSHCKQLFMEKNVNALKSTNNIRSFIAQKVEGSYLPKLVNLCIPKVFPKKPYHSILIQEHLIHITTHSYSRRRRLSRRLQRMSKCSFLLKLYTKKICVKKEG